MTLTKAQIIEAFQNQMGFTKNQSSDIVESILSIIKETLADGDDVLISGFGKFCVREKKERRGRNPATGDDMMLRPKKGIFSINIFLCALKAFLNENLSSGYMSSIMSTTGRLIAIGLLINASPKKRRQRE